MMIGCSRPTFHPCAGKQAGQPIRADGSKATRQARHPDRGPLDLSRCRGSVMYEYHNPLGRLMVRRLRADVSSRFDKVGRPPCGSEARRAGAELPSRIAMVMVRNGDAIYCSIREG